MYIRQIILDSNADSIWMRCIYFSSIAVLKALPRQVLSGTSSFLDVGSVQDWKKRQWRKDAIAAEFLGPATRSTFFFDNAMQSLC